MLQHENGSRDIGYSFLAQRASRVVHASYPLMGVADWHEHDGKGSGQRAGRLAGDSSLAVVEKLLGNVVFKKNSYDHARSI